MAANMKRKFGGVSVIAFLLIAVVHGSEEKVDFDSTQASGNWSSVEEVDNDSLIVNYTDNKTLSDSDIIVNETDPSLDIYDVDDEYDDDDFDNNFYKLSDVPVEYDDEDSESTMKIYGNYACRTGNCDDYDPNKQLAETDDDELQCDDPEITDPECEEEEGPKPVGKKKKALKKRKKDDEFYYKHKGYSGRTKNRKKKPKKNKRNWKKNCCIRGKRVGNNEKTFMSEDLLRECQERSRKLGSRMSKHCRWIFWSCCEARALRRYYIRHKAGTNNCTNAEDVMLM